LYPWKSQLWASDNLYIYVYIYRLYTHTYKWRFFLTIGFGFLFSLGEQEIMIFIYYLLSTLIDPWAFFPLVRWNASLYSHFQDLLHHFSESTKNNQVFGRDYKVTFFLKNLVQTSSSKLQICVVWLSQNVNLLTWAS
jgi:hypothetical protein